MRPTRRGHFGDVLPSQSLGVVLNEEERNAKGRPRSAAGGRKLPSLAMGDLGGKDNRKNQGRSTTQTNSEIRNERKN